MTLNPHYDRLEESMPTSAPASPTCPTQGPTALPSSLQALLANVQQQQAQIREAPRKTVAISSPAACPWGSRGMPNMRCDRCRDAQGGVVRERLTRPALHIVDYHTADCYQEVYREHLLRASGLPAALWSHTFAGAGRTGDRAGYLQLLQDWDWTTGRGLYVWGTNGVGKSYGTHCLTVHLAAQGVAVQWATTAVVVQAARNFQGRQSPSDTYDPLARFINAPVLVLDDMGKEALASDWGREQLFRLIDGRVNEGRPMVVTSNWTPEALEARMGENYGAAIVSRLLGSCQVLEMQGNDLRRGGVA
jgi:DNA replication protein DnaC